MDNKQLEDEIYNTVHELNQTWIQTSIVNLHPTIDPPFELIDNSFDIIIKLFGNYVWTSVNEERPYVIDENEEKQYQPMKEYLIKQVDNLEECVKMYKQSLLKESICRDCDGSGLFYQMEDNPCHCTGKDIAI